MPVPGNNYDYYSKNEPYGPNGKVPMDMFTDSNTPNESLAPTAAEVGRSIRLAVDRGWRVIPDVNGTFIVKEPDYVRHRRKRAGHINRVPDAAFLVDFLSTTLLRVVGGTHANVEVSFTTDNEAREQN